MYYCPRIQFTVSKPWKILGAGIVGGALGLFDGASTWGIYRLSGETISQRWTRELQEIQIENAANDKTQKELR